MNIPEQLPNISEYFRKIPKITDQEKIMQNFYLKPKQIQALILMFEGNREDHICQSVGITQKTLWNWKNQKYFKDAWWDMYDRINQEIATRVSVAANELLDFVFEEIRKTRDVKAALKLLSINAQMRSMIDIEVLKRKVEDLETRGAPLEPQ